MQVSAIVEITDPNLDPTELANFWNGDDHLCDLGQAKDAGRDAAFPLDPVSIGTAILIGVAAWAGSRPTLQTCANC
ncbi:MAG: hypothetical protein AAFN44_19905 [Pseudomonadota bacterium]